MPSKAGKLAARSRHRKAPRLGMGAGDRGGGAFLPDVFADARQYIDMALGADPNADPATWSWTDMTRFFLWDPGVTSVIGQRNESPGITPASFTGRMKNNQGDGGWFTVENPLSPFWPNIRENTPIRRRIDIGNGSSIRFFGYVTSWDPIRNAAGKLNLVSIQAHGVSQRLRQGASAAQSPMYRYHMLSYRFPTSTNLGWPDADQQYHQLPTHYWPLEESSGALQGSNAIDPAFPLVAEGADRVPQFGGDRALPGVAALCRFTDGTSLQANVPVVRPGGPIEEADSDVYEGIRVQVLVRLDESTQASLRESLGTLLDATTARVLTVRLAMTGAVGDVQQAVVYFDADPTDGLLLYADLLDSTGASVDGSPMGGLVGVPWERGVYVTLDFTETATGSELRFGIIPLSVNPATGEPIDDVVIIYDVQTFALSSIVGLSEFLVAEGGNMAGAGIGQLSVYRGFRNTFPDRYPHALLARSGDSVATRLYRLGVEQNVPIEIVGGADDIPMGPQGTAGFLALVDEAVRVDQGLLLDGLSAGLTYVTRTQMYSQAPGIVFDSSSGDELGPSQPRHSDQGRVNDYTAASSTGGSERFVQEDGPLGTDTVGTYDSGGDHKAALAGDLYQIAAWRVGLGTVPGLRYPHFRFQLAKPVTAAKAQQWLDMTPGRHMRILNAQPGLPDPDKSQLLLGWTERSNSKIWEITSNAIPYDSYAVTVLADDADTDSEFLGWLDTDGMTTLGTVAAVECLFDGVEEGVTGWSAQSSWTVAADTAQVRTGAQSMKLTPPGAVASGGAEYAAGTPCTAGGQYLVEAWFYSSAGWSDCRAAVDWYDAANAIISSSVGGATVVPAAVWTVSRQTFTAPAAAVSGRLRARQGGTPTAADVVWVDDLVFMPLLQVVTPSGPVATHDALDTYADDIDGLYVSAAGLKLRVLGITGATSPQTMIIDPAGLLKTLPSGSSVSAWNPVRLGL